jgi:hypothetical protein
MGLAPIHHQGDYYEAETDFFKSIRAILKNAKTATAQSALVER